MTQTILNLSGHEVEGIGKTAAGTQRLKGFLKSAFAGAVLMGAARFAFSSSVRALDWGGAGTALAVGTWSAFAEARKDYLKARAVTKEQAQLQRAAALRSIWTAENNKKYARKFLAGAAGGFLGAWGLDLVLDHIDTSYIKDAVQSMFQDSSASLPALPAAPALNEITDPLPPPPVPLLPQEQLAGLLNSNDLSAQAKNTIEQALQGKSWAMNEAIDGLLNDRFGFEKNEALAVELTKRLAATGDAEGQLKLAYMQYNGQFAALGVARDQESAMETVRRLGRAWYGGEEVLDQAARSSAPLISPAPEAPVPPTDAMACTAVQQAAGAADAFTTSCAPGAAAFVPGNSIALSVRFNDGVTKTAMLMIGSQINEMPVARYLEQALSSALTQMALIPR